MAGMAQDNEHPSRRDLLRLGALAVPAAAAWNTVDRRPGRPAPLVPPLPPSPAAPGNPFVKPVPPEWFTILGTNAEMRWDAAGDLGYLVPNERFFVRNHTFTPAIDVRQWRLSVFGSGLRHRPGADQAVVFD